MQYIDETPDLDTRVELIKTLNNVSAGKVCMFGLSLSSFFGVAAVCCLDAIIYHWLLFQIYVEIERARLVRKLAKIKEEQGLIAEAADLMQEVAVCLTQFYVFLRNN